MSEHRTPDLHFAAYVMALDYTLLPPTREGQRCFFGFDIDPQEWHQLSAEYHGRTGTVIAYEYSQCLRALKNLVHSI